LELALLLPELVDPELVVLALPLVVLLHVLDLLLQSVYFTLVGVAHVVGVLVPVEGLFLEEPLPLPDALVEDLQEGFEDVVEQEGLDEVPMLMVLLHESNLLLVVHVLVVKVDP